MPWPLVLASGGPRERGRAIGEQAAARIARSVAIYEEVFGRYTGLAWRDVRRHAEAYVEAIDDYDVQLLPELEGIAEGAALEPEDVLAINLRTEIMFGLDARAAHAAMKECTAIAARPEAAGGHVVVGQNWDWKPAVRDTCVLLACAPHDRPAFVTFVEAGLWAKCGANEVGIGLATNALQSSRDRGEPGVPYHAILRRVLTSATFEEATSAVRDAPRASSANYLIASSDGRAVDLETAPGGAEDLCVFEDPALAHTNHFLWPSPLPFEDLGRIDGQDSLTRLDSAQTSIRAGADLTVEAVLEALRSHAGEPESVCVHPDPAVDPVEDYVTVGAFAADLTEGSIALTRGNPCTEPVERHDLANLVAQARHPA
ncbi:MAG: C45 family autoproteolytic acyltransferase/hydrolase [Planctomycetaceae bacterium]